MPKADRCAQLKKQSEKAFKKLPADVRKDIQGIKEEPEQEEVQETPAAAAARLKGAKAAEAKSTFSKAAILADNVSDDDDGDSSNSSNSSSPPSKAARPTANPQDGAKAEKKKDSAAETKKQRAAKKRSDSEMLEEEQLVARRQRVIGRLGRFFLFGYVLEGRNQAVGEAKPKAPSSKDGKTPKKKKVDSGRLGSQKGFLEKVDFLGGPFLMLAFTVALFGFRMMEEGFVPMDAQHDGADYYEDLGLHQHAEILDVRKAYKGLAVKWHPDKNPDCEACASKFARISKAYETLSNPETKKAYDDRQGAKGSLVAANSVELTTENFEARVLRSNEVWIVQVYDPSEQNCGHFHPMWEDVSATHAKGIKFGRIDQTKHPGARNFLPQRVVILPTIFRFARGEETELYIQQQDTEESASAPFKRWVVDSFPGHTRLGSAKEIKAWWQKTDRPRLLVAASRRIQGSLELRRVAHVWAEFFDIVFADLQHAQAALSEDLKDAPRDGQRSWALVLRPRGDDAQAHVSFGSDSDELPGKLQDAMKQLAREHAPLVTVRNLWQLCGADAAASARTFCLVLVNSDAAAEVKALADVNASHVAYTQELQDLKASGDEVTEEAFHVQPVQVSTHSSRWPWNPAAADHPVFHSVWEAAGFAPAFVMELETRRVAGVRSSGYGDIFQQIAYDDLKFKELPEQLVLEVGFPDPESTLGAELRRVLSTFAGAVAAYVVVAILASVLPELPIPHGAGVVATVFLVVLLIWPSACRRLLTLFWPASPHAI